MTSLFADSSYYIALLLEADQMHSRAIELSRHYRTGNPRIVTTAWVMTEVANTCSSSALRPRFLKLLDDLTINEGALIVGPDVETFNHGIELYRSRSDKNWSLTDCISFVVMNREEITEALTADRDFEQAGFKALMR